MAFCRYCGNKIEDDARFCNNCGAKVEVEAPKAEPAPTYAYATKEEPKEEVSKGGAVTSMVFGIISTFTSIFCYVPFAFFIFTALSIVFISISNSKRNAYLNAGGTSNGFVGAAKATSIVGLVLTILFTIVGFIITVGLISEM